MNRKTLIVDNDSKFGCISYPGETLGDFLDEVGLDIKTTSRDEILEALEEAGCKLSM